MTEVEDRMNSVMSPEHFALLGEDSVAYVRKIEHDDLHKLFPQAPKMMPGIDLFALYRADGTPIVLTDSREAAVANAMEHDLTPVSVH